jgi:hypothetical protein
LTSKFRRVAVAASVYYPGAFKILEAVMDKDRIRGLAEQAKGKVKVVGKVTGDRKLEGEGGPHPVRMTPT